MNTAATTRLTHAVMIAAALAAVFMARGVQAAEPQVVVLPKVMVTGHRAQVVRLPMVMVTGHRVESDTAQARRDEVRRPTLVASR
ncbi:MAG TPA: hypothetical protein VF169_17825 [Albitalea sp.]|uniref:hypothetical protein n=1 Tax=Piscinibacter sp. TaxID=1903157 RepID=UPI002ED3F3CC